MHYLVTETSLEASSVSPFCFYGRGPLSLHTSPRGRAGFDYDPWCPSAPSRRTLILVNVSSLLRLSFSAIMNGTTITANYDIFPG